jgi:CMP-N-acetylneuraminic acid synthetase
VSAAVAVVPARAGSKGVPGKNVRELAGHPLIAYAVAAGCAAASVERVVVSTDSSDIAATASAYGAEVPCLRPPELSLDTSTDLEFLAHVLGELDETVDLLVLLRPTTPLREPKLVDEAVRMLRSRDDATSLRSVHELAEPPQKMLGIADGLLVGLFPDDLRDEYYNLPRQSFPPAYHPNGYVDVIRAEVVRSGAVYGPRPLAFITPPVVEVDVPEDFERLEFALARGAHPIVERLGRG